MIRVQVSDEGKVVLVNSELSTSEFGKWSIDINEARALTNLIPTAITNAYSVLKRRKELEIRQAQEDLAKLEKLEKEHVQPMQKLGDNL